MNFKIESFEHCDEPGENQYNTIARFTVNIPEAGVRLRKVRLMQHEDDPDRMSVWVTGAQVSKEFKRAVAERAYRLVEAFAEANDGKIEMAD